MTIRLTADGVDIVSLVNNTDCDRWVEHYLSSDEMCGWYPNPHLENTRGRNILCPNYGPLPKPMINQLVIPTGATRWSYTLLLLNTEQKNLVFTAAEANGNKLKLQFGAGRNVDNNINASVSHERPVHLAMSPLPPHPVTPTALETSDRLNSGSNNPFGLWVVPFVDCRYWWQYQDVGDIDAETFSDPLDLMNYLWGRVGTGDTFAEPDRTESVNENYLLVPDVVGNSYENAATILESVCWHLGLTITPNLQNNFTESDPQSADRWVALGIDASTSVHNMNLNGRHFNMLTGGTWAEEPGMENRPLRSFGGELSGVSPLNNGGDGGMPARYLPETVFVKTGNAPWFESDQSANAEAVPETSIRIRVGYDKGPLEPPPQTDPDADRIDPIDPIDRIDRIDRIDAETIIPQQVADDYIAKHSRQHDFCFVGTQNWQPTAFDDFVIHHHRMVMHDGQSTAKAYTRVRSWRNNIIPTQIDSDQSLAVIVDSIEEGSSGLTPTRVICTVCSWDAETSTYEQTSRTKEVFSHGGEAPEVNTFGFAHWIDCAWRGFFDCEPLEDRPEIAEPETDSGPEPEPVPEETLE